MRSARLDTRECAVKGSTRCQSSRTWIMIYVHTFRKDVHPPRMKPTFKRDDRYLFIGGSKF